jgi:cobyrinic acid a,c-diamide synthase
MFGLLVGGAASGAGKTTVTLGLMAALRRRGLRVQGFKVGPDFIDAGLHAAVTGRSSHNLDGWLLSEEEVRAIFARHVADADVALVEGVMGLFDGLDGGSDRGSSAEIALWLRLPVLLVVDASAAVRSAAATVLGFEAFDPRLRLAGVVFNRVGGARHASWLRDAATASCRSPVLGTIPWEQAVRIPERHLGLFTAEAGTLSPERVTKLADLVEAHVDVDRLLHLGHLADAPAAPPARLAFQGLRCRIGIARDEAFCFYYAENLARLEAEGAELVPFSPLRDVRLPESLDGLYLGGGYPELHAPDLAANGSIREDVRAHAAAGLPVYAECGGFMYLTEAIQDPEGRWHPMVGWFPVQAIFPQAGLTLHYVRVRIEKDCCLGPRGAEARGHEFHRSRMSPMPSSIERVLAIAEAPGDSWRSEGYRRRNVLATYVHQHFGSQPSIPFHFIEACRAARGVTR